jgi:hypothetical protein
MDTSTRSQSVSLGWKLLILIPIGLAVVLDVISARQINPRTGIELPIIGNILLEIAFIALGVYWIVGRKLTGLGIMTLIVASTVLGFGLHTLLRVLTH